MAKIRPRQVAKIVAAGMLLVLLSATGAALLAPREAKLLETEEDPNPFAPEPRNLRRLAKRV